MLDMTLARSPLIFRGDERTAYRDPALYHDGTRFHLFFTLVENIPGGPYLRLAKSTSRDLTDWTVPRPLTPRDKTCNYSSPGNVIRFGGRYVLCLQTYPRENGEKYANDRARLFVMESDDLETFSPPRLLRVKGQAVPPGDMGRMIDPYLAEDPAEKGLWWCFFKQNGVSAARSRDLVTWEFAGHMDGGENVCIFRRGNDYVMLHAPENGIGVRRSPDLRRWTDEGVLTLGQDRWPWARGRITAGAALDVSALCGEPMYVMVFHGSGPADESVDFDKNASIGLVYSRDGRRWQWNGD